MRERETGAGGLRKSLIQITPRINFLILKETLACKNNSPLREKCGSVNMGWKRASILTLRVRFDTLYRDGWQNE